MRFKLYLSYLDQVSQTSDFGQTFNIESMANRKIIFFEYFSNLYEWFKKKIQKYAKSQDLYNERISPMHWLRLKHTKFKKAAKSWS